MNAEQQEQIAAIDGHLIAIEPLYQIVIVSKGVERSRSLPMTASCASVEMRRIIALHTQVMGYRQDPGGANGVTLKKDNIRLEVSKVEAKKS